MLVLNSKDRRSMFPEEKADAPFSFFRKLAGFKRFNADFLLTY